MESQQSTSPQLGRVLGDAAQEIVTTGLVLLRESARGGVALVGGLVGSARSLASRSTGRADETVRHLGSDIVSRIDNAVQLRMTRLLNAFQIPTSKDLHELTERVEQLDRELKKMNARAARAKKRPVAGRKSNGRAS